MEIPVKMAPFLFLWHLCGVKLILNLLDSCGHLKVAYYSFVRVQEVYTINVQI